MNADALLQQLTCHELGRRLECQETLPSTNDRAREFLDLFGPAAHGAVVVADRQTAGRGRMGRSWYSQPGSSLSLSVALWPGGEPSGFGTIPLAAALAVREALKGCGVAAGLKWPNDVLVGGRKVAGVLLEGRFSGDEHRGMALGIGVNLAQKREEFPAEFRAGATSVLAETGVTPDAVAFAAALLNALEPLLERAQSDPAGLVASAATAWVHRLGEAMVLETGGGRLEGRFAGVGPEGELRLETPRGVMSLVSGEVVHVRPLEAP